MWGQPLLRYTGLSEKETPTYFRRGELILNGARSKKGGPVWFSKKELYLRSDKTVLLIAEIRGTDEFITLVGSCTGSYVEYGALSIGGHHINNPEAVTPSTIDTGSVIPWTAALPPVEEAPNGTYTSMVYNFPEGKIKLEPDDYSMLAAKKYTAYQCKPSMATGKMRLFFQAILGSYPERLSPVNTGVFHYTTNGKHVSISYNNIIFRDDNGTYWLISASGTSAGVWRMTFSECAAQYLAILKRGRISEDENTTGLTREQEAQLETILFTYYVVPDYENRDRTKGAVNFFSVPLSPELTSIGHHWHAAYRLAEAVSVGGLPFSVTNELCKLTISTTQLPQPGDEDQTIRPPVLNTSILDSGTADRAWKKDWVWSPNEAVQAQQGGTPDGPGVAGTKPQLAFYDWQDEMVAVYYYRSGVIATVTDEVPRNYFCAPEGTWHEHTKVKSNFVNTGWIVTGGGGGVAPMADQYTSVDNVTDAYTEFSGVTEEMIGDFTYSPDGYSFPRLPAGSVICPGGVDAAPTICPPGVWRAFFYDSGSTIVEKVKSLNTGAQPRTLYMIPFDTVDGCYVGAMTQTFSVGDIFENNYKGYNTYYEEFGCGYRKAIYETMNSTPYLHEKIGDNEETITWEVYAVTQNGIFPVDSGSVSRSWKDGEPKPPMPPLSAWGDMLATSDGQFPQYKFTMRFGVTTLGQYTAQPKEDMIHIGGHIAGDRFIGWA